MDHRSSLDWADMHLERLKTAFQAFLHLNPFEVVSEYDAQTSDEVVRVRVKRSQPPEWLHIIGDCLHNHRVALDHLVWSLVLKHTPVPLKPKRILFPIYDDRGDYVSRGANAVAEASGIVQAAVESLQPYHGWHTPEPHPLFLLNEMEIVHKHRHLLAAGSVLTGTQIRIHGDPGGRLHFHSNVRYGAFEDGVELARYHVVPPGPEPKVEFDYRVTFDIAFAEKGPARGTPVGQTLERIRDHIRNVVFPKLEPLL